MGEVEACLADPVYRHGTHHHSGAPSHRQPGHDEQLAERPTERTAALRSTPRAPLHQQRKNHERIQKRKVGSRINTLSLKILIIFMVWFYMGCNRAFC